MKDDTVYLRHILDAVHWVESYTVEVAYEGFLCNKMMQDAVVRQLEVIGEAAGSLSAGLVQAYPEVAWGQIISMRNRLMHAYSSVDLGIVWEIASADLPLLKEQVAHILETCGEHGSVGESL